MENNPATSIDHHFADLNDPRIDRTRRHQLIDILVIAICALICGADNWEEVQLFGEAKEKWFRTFLELPNGIPSHDTFWRMWRCKTCELPSGDQWGLASVYSRSGATRISQSRC